MVNKASFNERIPIGETCTIASGQTISNAVFLNGGSLLSFQTPNLWDSNNTFLQGSIDGVYFTDLVNENNDPFTWATGATAGYQVHPTITSGWRYIKIVSGTAQTLDRIINLGIRQVV